MISATSLPEFIWINLWFPRAIKSKLITPVPMTVSFNKKQITFDN